jgi:uncharacterized membrane protein YcaP (DUF421 family)
MHPIFAVDWNTAFVPTVSLLEIVLRGTVMYLTLFALLRVMNRGSGRVGLADLLLIVLIADAAQNAMASDYKSITEGIVLVATLVFWNYALDWLGDRIPWVQRRLHPAPVTLVKDGKILRRNMRQELVSEDELMSQLRLQGVDDLAEVKEACMEGNGEISVVKKDK